MKSISSIQDVAALVKARRKAQKVSQTVLAQLSNVGLRFVRDVEDGKESVHFGKLLAVLTTLGIRLDMDTPEEA